MRLSDRYALSCMHLSVGEENALCYVPKEPVSFYNFCNFEWSDLFGAMKSDEQLST